MIGPDQKWNEDIVKKTFSPHDAEQFVGIKFLRKPCNDFAAWNFEKTRIFSVKSAYKLAYNLAHECLASQGNSNTGDAS
jgi:hypothetical protein